MAICAHCKEQLDPHDEYELQCQDTGSLCWPCMDMHVNGESTPFAENTEPCADCYREFRNVFQLSED